MTDRYEKRAEQYVEVQMSQPWTATEPKPYVPPPPPSFEAAMATVPCLYIGYGDTIEEAGEMGESWRKSDLTPAQRRQIADAMTAAWKEWADG